MTKISTTRAELSTLHGIMTRLEWIEREYLDLSPELRAALSEEREDDKKFFPLLKSLQFCMEDMINAAEKARLSSDDAFLPTESELARYSRAIDKLTRTGLSKLPLEARAALKATTDFKAKLALLEALAETI